MRLPSPFGSGLPVGRSEGRALWLVMIEAQTFVMATTVQGLEVSLHAAASQIRLYNTALGLWHSWKNDLLGSTFLAGLNILRCRFEAFLHWTCKSAAY